MKKFYIILTILLLSCGKTEEKPEAYAVNAEKNTLTLTPNQLQNAAIETAIVGIDNLAKTIKASGIVDVPPQNMASVSAPSGGYVKFTKFMPGMRVQKGETLALLEDPQIVQLQQDYLLSKSNWGYAQKDYARQSDLNRNKASSDKVLQQAQTEANNQNIMMRGMAEKLRALGIDPSGITANNMRRTIAVKSPVSGYISAVNVKIGQYVSPTERLFEVVNTEDVHLALSIFEKDLQNIFENQKVIAYTNQNPDKKYKAHISLIGKDFQPNRSVVVYCHFIDYDKSLIPGTFMNAEIETQREKGLSVPEDAVVTWENKQYLFEEIQPRTYKMTPIIIGNTENGKISITGTRSSLNNKKVVIKGAYHLLMGLKNVEE